MSEIKIVLNRRSNGQLLVDGVNVANNVLAVSFTAMPPGRPEVVLTMAADTVTVEAEDAQVFEDRVPLSYREHQDGDCATCGRLLAEHTSDGRCPA